ncbi:MAG: hydroxyacid dehydrogenase [Clostridia bacterium]|nr:hydroxyacid dehydrogenase [Clostridia bacterium]
MNILLSVHNGIIKDKYFPGYIMEALGKLGRIKQNTNDRPWTEEELSENIKGMDVCITHWQSPKITPEVLACADRLKLVAHCAGSVYNIVSPEVFEKGITVVGANRVMARAVAEGTLAYMLASLLKIKKYSDLMQGGGWKEGISGYGDMKTLYDRDVLLVGFGDIGRFVYALLLPFNVNVSVYDPHLKIEIMQSYPAIDFTGDLDNAIRKADVVSLHASKNPGSDKLMNRARIDLMKDGALLVNTARGSLVDEEYLVGTLKSGRIQAALDVFEEEPLPLESELRNLPNVLCMPHVAGSGVVTGYAEAMAADIANFMNGRPLEYEITAEKAGMMTRE